MTQNDIEMHPLIVGDVREDVVIKNARIKCLLSFYECMDFFFQACHAIFFCLALFAILYIIGSVSLASDRNDDSSNE